MKLNLFIVGATVKQYLPWCTAFVGKDLLRFFSGFQQRKQSNRFCSEIGHLSVHLQECIQFCYSSHIKEEIVCEEKTVSIPLLRKKKVFYYFIHCMLSNFQIYSDSFCSEELKISKNTQISRGKGTEATIGKLDTVCIQVHQNHCKQYGFKSKKDWNWMSPGRLHYSLGIMNA